MNRGDTMAEKIGEVILNYDYYSGEDYYSDGEIEDRLLQIVKENDSFEQIISEEKSWPILYHFSALRGNIVDWIDIRKTDTVLEIGAGCGAISGTLCRKAGKVIANDLSKKRCLINAYRNKEYRNLEIYVGNFNEVSKNLNQKFDYITLIGVFEYAESYMDSENEYLDFLCMIEKLLKPNGKIIIAIENRLGLKYWAGCKEDHVGKYFEGLEGYSDTKGVHTFSKAELIKMFKSRNLSYEFYYPYPDYKLPTNIYSDDYLPNKGELMNNLRNFDSSRYVLFDETKVFDSLLESNLFPEFSNSYLVVLEKEGS